MIENKITLNGVSKVYNMYNSPTDKLKETFSLSGKVLHTEFHALTDISFSVEKGEILGIMGRNGAGKSTLLKIITGIIDPTSGNVEVTGRISSLLELGTGFNMEYTGIENIYFYGTLMGLSKSEIDKKVDDIIAFAEIGDYIEQVVKTYSSGMFARLAFSCAINVEPEILIVDEILSVGDMRFQAKCFNKFKEFKKRGVTILYVGHDVNLMRSFCDRCMWIDGGHLVAEGDPTYITAQFTEFMYLEDIQDFTSYKKWTKKVKEEPKADVESKNQILEVNKDEKKSDLENAKKITVVSQVSDKSKFPNCLAHWGTKMGLIEKVKMIGADGEEKNYFNPHEYLKIEVYLKSDATIEKESFSVAVSIKNKEGTDLCVKTTHDENIIVDPKREQCVIFEFKPMLANGEYYLVVALENRMNMNPTYYEYIEGIQYFKMYSDNKIFGIYDVEANITVK